MAIQSELLTQKINNTLQQSPQERQDKYGQYSNELGLKDSMGRVENARKSVLEIDRLLGSLPTNINRRTGGRLMTQGQRDRLTASERNPLMNQLQAASRGEQVASSGLDLGNQELNRRMGLFEQGGKDQLLELIRQRDMAFNQEGQERERAFQKSMSYNNKQSYSDPFAEYALLQQKIAQGKIDQAEKDRLAGVSAWNTKVQPYQNVISKLGAGGGLFSMLKNVNLLRK